jgi:hypothetical protein
MKEIFKNPAFNFDSSQDKNDFFGEGAPAELVTSVYCYHPPTAGALKFCEDKKLPVPKKCNRHIMQIYWAHLTPGAKAVVWVSTLCPRCKRKVKFQLASEKKK